MYFLMRFMFRKLIISCRVRRGRDRGRPQTANVKAWENFLSARRMLVTSTSVRDQGPLQGAALVAVRKQQMSKAWENFLSAHWMRTLVCPLDADGHKGRALQVAEVWIISSRSNHCAVLRISQGLGAVRKQQMSKAWEILLSARRMLPTSSRPSLPALYVVIPLLPALL